ncbi:MAG: lamin tail domain-containing protein, partial [Phycisphaerales bacterium]|nr:lamin tail domain-containing protein [Phycisphaerales bacterium]
HTDDVWITAEVSAGGSPVSLVELYFREIQSGVYLRVPMADDGASNDGAAGDGVYGALLPVNAGAGQRVDYYVGATAANTYESVSFMPALTEYGPLSVNYAFGAGGVRITEWGYSLDSGEFIEFTNLTDAAIDMTGWSYDDGAAVAGEFDLSAFGSVAAGESVVLTEAEAEAFRVAWGLDPSVKIIGELGVMVGHNLGRNDQINLFDDAGVLSDRLTYGDENIPGSIRTRDATGQACLDDIGTDNALAWLLSETGDAFGSFAASTGEFGTPGSYDASACDDCPADMNGDGILDLTDVQVFITAFTAGDLAADLNGNGILDLTDVQGFVISFIAGCV